MTASYDRELIHGEFYLHIGMHKTATSFFQQVGFRQLEGVRFYAKPRLNQFLDVKTDEKCLLSDESIGGYLYGTDRREFIRNLSRLFPDARIIVGFRRHADWLTSAYSEYLRFGGMVTFDKFLDLDNDKGVIGRDEMHYQPIIDCIHDCFSQRPFIYLMREVKVDVKALLREIAAYMGVSVNDDYATAPRNPGFSLAQQEFLRRLNGYSRSPENPEGILRIRGRRFRKLGLTPSRITSKLRPVVSRLPAPSRDLYLEAVSSYFQDDWKAVVSSAKANRGSLIA